VGDALDKSGELSSDAAVSPNTSYENNKGIARELFCSGTEAKG